MTRRHAVVDPVNEQRNPARGELPGRPSSETDRTVLEGFHPAVRGWFESAFDHPTRVQERGWSAIRSGDHTLIAAPTGSGKTLTAFLNALDELLREGVERGGSLPDETYVVYVSPLKALSADVHKNLAEPRQEIRRVAKEMGVDAPRITAAVRSGDTSASARAQMVRRPPHILVTTPESLYLLLTSARSREALGSVRTVIVDEIHAVVESRRGAHLALSLERLDHVTGRKVQRIGLSATQKPIEDVARFLVGCGSVDAGERPNCRIIDEGHARTVDVRLELPQSPLEAVLSGDVREEIVKRIAALIEEHTTTLVFVNTRREAERTVHQLAEILGEDAITAHHGSLSKEARLDAEQRLKEGRLRALVATASLELGIDIGHVDLVCQMGFPKRISTFLQRVGRSGHTVTGTPKGRLFPLTRNELVECAALLWCVQRGELDHIIMREAPMDILAQQIVAEAACEDWEIEALCETFRRAYVYCGVSREQFAEIVQMLSRGFATSRGRRGARIHFDAVNGRIRGRRGSRLAAITSGGAIPDNADYRVIVEPENTFVGTVDEDFAVESMPGDIFQLGSSSWRIQRVETGVVRVEDARGEPPSIPFWFGEAPARSVELSEAVSDIRKQVSGRLPDEEAARRWLVEEIGIDEPAARQIVEYLSHAKRLLGALPTRDTLVLERFFDDAGGMQLILHAPFGSRVNRAWGLALRKRFCRQFNFELQAAATEEGILLSLGPQHSFPLEEVFGYLTPESVHDVLVQALLDAPMFQTRWRWTASLSLALLRWSNGRKVPPQIQRMQAEDLLVAVFPDAAACLENIAGDREVPEHPLVRQAIQDCLEEVMDLPALQDVLRRIQEGRIELVARDTPEPSSLAYELLTARPYAFLDDAPLEERRAAAVQTRRSLEPSSLTELGILTRDIVDQVRQEAWPLVENADELHDALLTFGVLTEHEGNSGGWTAHMDELAEQRRATRLLARDGHVLWIAAERLPEARFIWPDATSNPEVVPPPGSDYPGERAEAWKNLVRSRMALEGPTSAGRLGAVLGVAEPELEETFLYLEGEGSILRGRFTPSAETLEWCDRRLLARMHRYSVDRLRAEIEPVDTRTLIRFLLQWQHVATEHRVRGVEGTAAVLDQLEGFELPGVAWETDILPARCEEYSPQYLDELCSSGRIMWGRRSAPTGEARGLRTSGPIRSSPIALWKRENASLWIGPDAPSEVDDLGAYARAVYHALRDRGASFFHDLVVETSLLPTQVEQGLGELAALGMVTSDSFSGLRALLTPVDKRPSGSERRRRGRTAPYGVHAAGRWSLLRGGSIRGDEVVEQWARVLLRRYGVVFRRLLLRETGAPPWRDLVRFYWRLEARGEVRGGRFVAGFSGEQFALPEAVGTLRKLRRAPLSGTLITLSAADPLNLVGILTPGERVPAISSNRIAYRDGLPAFTLEGRDVRSLNGESVPHEVRTAMRRRSVPPELRVFVK